MIKWNVRCKIFPDRNWCYPSAHQSHSGNSVKFHPTMPLNLHSKSWKYESPRFLISTLFQTYASEKREYSKSTPGKGFMFSPSDLSGSCYFCSFIERVGKAEKTLVCAQSMDDKEVISATIYAHRIWFSNIQYDLKTLGMLKFKKLTLPSPMFFTDLFGPNTAEVSKTFCMSSSMSAHVTCVWRIPSAGVCRFNSISFISPEKENLWFLFRNFFRHAWVLDNEIKNCRDNAIVREAERKTRRNDEHFQVTWRDMRLNYLFTYRQLDIAMLYINTKQRIIVFSSYTLGC